jgi:hypothetical protein
MSIVDRPARASISRVPRLLVTVPLEVDPSLVVDAHSFEDELALRGWLRHSGYLDHVADVLVQLLDDMDACDAEQAR